MNNVAGLKIPLGHEFANQIEFAIRNCSTTNRSFAVVALQVGNMDLLRKRHNPEDVARLFQTFFQTVRASVHATQFVGTLYDGLGLVFDRIDVGQIDRVADRLTIVASQALRKAQKDDMAGRWSEILYQFLLPMNQPILIPTSGWAIYPRDGSTVTQLVSRAIRHVAERKAA